MVTDSVDHAASRLGLPAQALAVLMIVFGLLIIVLPQLLPWLVGILLVVLGVVWLLASTGALPRGPRHVDQVERPRV